MIEIKTLKDTEHYKISTRLLLQEALGKGYIITFFPSSPSTQSGVFRCEKNSREFFFKSTVGAVTPAYGVFAAEDKVLTHSLLAMNGVQTPETIVLGTSDTLDAVHDFLNNYQKVVVKPVDTNHGDGVSVNISTSHQLDQAIAYARAAGGKQSDVIIQQQVEGDEYRFLVVDGKIVAVAGRRPAFVVGDGVSTIAKLIDKKNNDPRRSEGHKGVLTKISCDDVVQHRGEEFLGIVPVKGQQVSVLDTSNLSRGGESFDVTDIASPAIKRLAVHAAHYCFLGVAGVDIITKDITAATADDSYVIEVNLAPGIRMHEFPSEGKARPAAKKIFQLFEKTAHPVARKATTIGRSEFISLPEFERVHVPARIDTGATITSVWASSIEETEGGLSFTLFDKKSEFYDGKRITVADYGRRIVVSSMGQTEVRYTVHMLIVLRGRRVRAKVTLADRSTQIYPVLVGRNILRNKFVVNVAGGSPLREKERARRNELSIANTEQEKS